MWLIEESWRAFRQGRGSLINKHHRQRYAKPQISVSLTISINIIFNDAGVPPYPPLNGTSCFTHYTKEGFDKNDHAELASIANILDKKGCNLMISNADIPFIRSLYDDKFILHELDVIRFIRADGKRYKVQELVITNY